MGDGSGPRADAGYEEHKYRQAKAWLDGLYDLRHDAAAAKALADSQREMMLGVRGLDPAKPHGPGAGGDAMADAVARFEEAARAYDVLAAELVGEQQRAFGRLRALPDARHRRCLGLRYLCGWRWERIQDAMGYSRDGMKSLHRRAVVAAWDVMPHWLKDPPSNAMPR